MSETHAYTDAVELPGVSLSDDALRQSLSRFAQETGRTASEWLEMWRAGEIVKTEATQERYQRALMLDGASKNQVTLETDDAR